MIAKKVKSVFDKFLPSRATREVNKSDTKDFKIVNKVFVREYMDDKSWKNDIIPRIAKFINMVKRKRIEHKRYHNQLKDIQ